MAKRLTAKIGEYQKDGQTKGRYVDLGVIMSNDKGEYVLLDPTVNLAGIMMLQRIMNPSKAGDRVMVSVFDNDRQGGQQRQQSGGYGDGGRPGGGSTYDDEVPFNPELRA